MQQHIPNNQLLQQLRAILPNYCDKCGSKMDAEDLEILSNQADRATCRLTCKTCGNSYVMHAQTSIAGLPPVMAIKDTLNTQIVKTELTTQEKEKFSQVTNIHTDEIIDVFQDLKKINSIEDFNKQFKKKK